MNEGYLPIVRAGFLCALVASTLSFAANGIIEHTTGIDIRYGLFVTFFAAINLYSLFLSINSLNVPSLFRYLYIDYPSWSEYIKFICTIILLYFLLILIELYIKTLGIL
jgi:hypothetical protein